MSEVQVTNRNPFPLPGRFAGQNYVFPPDEPVEISLQAARHIFGLGQDDKRRPLAQLGILKGTVSYQEALAVLNNVKFVEGYMTYAAQQQGPGGGQQTPQPGQPGQKPGEQHPGQQAPGQHPPGQKPGEKKGPGKDEEHEESEESGDRPGAPRSPGRKSEGAADAASSDDLKPSKRQW